MSINLDSHYYILVGGLEHFFHIFGKIIPTDIFSQRGWNHQPVLIDTNVWMLTNIISIRHIHLHISG